MTSMLALITKGSDGFEMASVDRPAAGATEVLIEVRAAGVNPADWKSRDGGPGAPVLPDGSILGWDIAGTVVEVGGGVTRFSVGDRVFGMPKFPDFPQAYAQFVAARSREIAKIPDAMSFVEAGALPLAGLTAWQTVVDTLRIGEGERLLIHAAAGGVGHLAVQVAKAQGAEVWGTASPKNHDALREFGIDHLIDYRSERFEDVATDMDAVLDLVGDGETSVRSLSTLRRGGRLAAISPLLPDADALAAAGVTASFVLVEPDYSSLESLAKLYESGQLKVIIAEQQPLADMAELHAIGRRGGPMGKLVATVDHDEQWVRVRTKDEYLAMCADVYFGEAAGRSIATSDGQIKGNFGGQELSGTWEWEDEFFCRTSTLGDMDLGHDCIVIEITETQMRLTMEKGNGPTVVYDRKDGPAA